MKKILYLFFFPFLLMSIYGCGSDEVCQENISLGDLRRLQNKDILCREFSLKKENFIEDTKIKDSLNPNRICWGRCVNQNRYNEILCYSLESEYRLFYGTTNGNHYFELQAEIQTLKKEKDIFYDTHSKISYQMQTYNHQNGL